MMLKLIQMEDTSLVALAGLSLSGYSFEQHPEMVSYVKQVSTYCGKKELCSVHASHVVFQCKLMNQCTCVY